MSLWAAAATVAGWLLLCLRWFDAAAVLRPGWLQALSPAWPAALLLLAATVLLVRWRGRDPGPVEAGFATLLVVGLAIAFRLPLIAWAAAGYTTADASMAGIMALRVRDGAEHLVYIPNLSYCGSLKSHLTVPLLWLMDAPRAFASASVGFYALFVAGVHRLGLLAAGPSVALGAGLWAAFSPTFVTQYSLSNDGNYVEVLALGTWALVLTAAWLRRPQQRPALALGCGVLLGLAFWCHVLGVIPLAAIAAALPLLGGVGAALRSAPALLGGFLLGDLPGLIWNARHGWVSFLYLLPSEYRGSAESLAAGAPAGPGRLERLWLMLSDHGPILMGYDPGYPAWLDALSMGLAVAGILAAATAAGWLALRWLRGRGNEVDALLLLFGATVVAVVLVALPHLPGNPRYVLFLATPIAVWLPQLLDRGWRRVLLAVLVSFGALGSLGQVLPKRHADVQWRGFVADLERGGVRYCYTDYYIAARVNFFSEERVRCGAALGPTTTDYFEHGEQVEAAPRAALIPVNRTAAEKLERRLERLGVAWHRFDSMKPVLVPERKVTPLDLFPHRTGDGAQPEPDPPLASVRR